MKKGSPKFTPKGVTVDGGGGRGGVGGVSLRRGLVRKRKKKRNCIEGGNE